MRGLDPPQCFCQQLEVHEQFSAERQENISSHLFFPLLLQLHLLVFR